MSLVPALGWCCSDIISTTLGAPTAAQQSEGFPLMSVSLRLSEGQGSCVHSPQPPEDLLGAENCHFQFLFENRKGQFMASNRPYNRPGETAHPSQPSECLEGRKQAPPGWGGTRGDVSQVGQWLRAPLLKTEEGKGLWDRRDTV